MDSFLDFLVRQKKFALVFSLAFIAIGVLSVVGMQRDQFPTVDFEVLSVTTAYPGASPEDVEKSVTNVIEEELLSVSGIKEITSSSREGISSIIVTLEADLKDVTTTKNDVRNAVNRVKAFPEEVTDLPQVIDFNVTEFPVVTINVIVHQVISTRQGKLQMNFRSLFQESKALLQLITQVTWIVKSK